MESKGQCPLYHNSPPPISLMTNDQRWNEMEAGVVHEDSSSLGLCSRIFDKCHQQSTRMVTPGRDIVKVRGVLVCV